MKNLSFLVLGILFCLSPITAQQVTTHQYRRVEPENMQEYLKRETTYWQKLAESEVTKGNLTFWAILQKVGGLDQDKGSNILIVNTFKDMDTANSIWGNIATIFPDTKMEDMQTWTISKNTHTIYLSSLGNHTVPPNVDPDKDFNYVYVLYHHLKDTGKHLKFEENTWKPLIEKAMAEGKTTMKGWGNSRILAPESNKFPYTTHSYDLFASLSDALGRGFSADFKFPEGFGREIEGNQAGPRYKNLYRIVAKVAASSD